MGTSLYYTLAPKWFSHSRYRSRRTKSFQTISSENYSAEHNSPGILNHTFQDQYHYFPFINVMGKTNLQSHQITPFYTRGGSCSTRYANFEWQVRCLHSINPPALCFPLLRIHYHLLNVHWWHLLISSGRFTTWVVAVLDCSNQDGVQWLLAHWKLQLS